MNDSGHIPPTAFFYYVSPDLYFIMNSGNNILVMCDAYTPAGNPIPTNKRYNAAKIFSNSKVVSEEPWYGIEEEYTLMQKGGPYYCGVGADKAIDRDIMDAHYKACLYAGIGISGVNGEVTLGQWEFQVGPIEGISTGDQVWVARYLLERITEISGVNVSFDPKPVPVSVSLPHSLNTLFMCNKFMKSMRNNGGLAVINNTIEKLQVKHKENIAAYGEGNECRLTGKHEIAYINMFSWGVANRGASWNNGGLAVIKNTIEKLQVKHKENIAAYGEGNERRLTGKHETTYINTFSWGVANRGASWNNGGLAVIKNTIEKLQVKHKENIAAYGEGNERRLTGKHEAAYINTFSWGVANRGASVRVGRDTEKEGKGYFEDRRPASNMDPYVVTSMIAETTILGFLEINHHKRYVFIQYHSNNNTDFIFVDISFVWVLPLDDVEDVTMPTMFWPFIVFDLT
ncbi:LOW QUALITY PROTEIN: hypothetical protein HID58_095520 [Brassica napus]|uniref:glutamine synthetase n=1 Tax=Brassica napus TaxID=3708 RepID=A0ABQ7X3V5_BRANA|nr:LOW QUALITY PROTEIN: hypothetical protein HID58_095520 [Brassica napus]